MKIPEPDPKTVAATLKAAGEHAAVDAEMVADMTALEVAARPVDA